MPSYDILVAGLGATGSAAVYHLARRGLRVLGVDRHAPPHAHGSSHGESRIIRRAYFEGTRYLPLIERAYVLWQELEQAAGRPLLRMTGGLTIGPRDGDVLQGARRTADAGGIAYELLAPEAVRRRFPAFHLPDDHAALFEPGAGVLDPEACLRAHLAGAREAGADLHVEEPVTRWRADGDGVRVETTRGTYHAGRLLLCAGGWMPELLPALAPLLHLERQVNGWFRPAADAGAFDAARCPVYVWSYAPGRALYGFPDLGQGVKAGIHHGGAPARHPDDLRRTPAPDDEAALRAVLRRLLPAADGPLVRAATCFYTNTPDRDYLIDVHPEHPRVLFASACSGHGFKASNAIGEALAALAVEGHAWPALDAFRAAGRFA